MHSNSAKNIERIRKIAEDLAHITSSDSGDAARIRSQHEIIYEYIQHIDEPIEYLSTGFSAIDDALNIQKGRYVIIGARPGTGKSALRKKIS